MNKRITLLLTILIPFFVSFSALLPDVIEYWVPSKSPGEDSIAEWWSEYEGQSELRNELNAARVGILVGTDAIDSVQAADRLLNGKLHIHGRPESAITFPFSANDIKKGPPSQQPNFASLFIVDVFLEAYNASREEKYLGNAFLVADRFLEYEEKLWLPVAYIWNDHAIAARTLLMTRLVDALMESKLVGPAKLKRIFAGIDHSVRLLAKPSQFTFRTNHGIIQSLAVLHVAAFNDRIPAISDHLDEVLSRLEEQMEFFISDDGVVREHSAGYQEFGVTLLEQAIRYYELLGIPLPEGWRDKRRLAVEFLTHLSRPDGTIPRYGDTNGPGRMHLDGPRSNIWMSEDFGYWSSWLSGSRHLFVPWAKLMGNAHKHADEMSVFFWADGVEWWTGTGYWPYGHSRQLAGFGWSGSNAPHTEGESTSSQRQSRVVNWVATEKIGFLHLQRNRPDGYQVDRFVIEEPNGYWAVIDSPSGSATKNSVTTWLTMNSVDVTGAQADDTYYLTSPSISTILQVGVSGGAGTTFSWMNGENDSDVGWIAVNGKAVPTNVLVAKIPANSWSLISWSTQDEEMSIGRIDWSSSREWTLRYSSAGVPHRLKYMDDALVYEESGKDGMILALHSGKPHLDSLARSDAQFLAAQHKYSRYRDLLPYRTRAWINLTTISIVQALLLVGYCFHKRRVPAGTLMSVLMLLWLGLALWLHASYFVA